MTDNAGWLSTLYPTAIDRAIADFEREAEFRRRQADEFHAVSPTGEQSKASMHAEADYHAEMAEVLRTLRDRHNPIGWARSNGCGEIVFRQAGHPANDAKLPEEWHPVYVGDRPAAP